MDYQELTQIWKDSSNKESVVEINKKLLKNAGSNLIKNNLLQTKWNAIISLIINYIWGKFLIEFIVGNYPEINFILPAFFLLVIAIYSIVFDIYKLTLHYSINNQETIIQTQKKLERLRVLELFDNNTLYFFMPAFFVPFVIVVALGFFGVDVYAMGFSEREMIFSTIFTFFLSVVIVYFLNKFPSKEIKESLAVLREMREIDKG